MCITSISNKIRMQQYIKSRKRRVDRIKGNEVGALGAYSDEVKKYTMQRDRKNKNQAQIVSYPKEEACNVQDIKVLVLFSNEDQRYVNEMQAELANKRIIFTRGLDDTPKAYGKKENIAKSFDYVVLIISKSFLEDLDLLDILAAIYKADKPNKKILTTIVWKKLYQPEVKAGVLEKLRARIDDYKAHFLKNDFAFVPSEDLQRMQKKLEMLEHFIDFAIERDPKRNITCGDKLLKYIYYVSGKDVADREPMPQDVTVDDSVAKDKGAVVYQTNTYNINAEQNYIANDHAIINETAIQDDKPKNTGNGK